MQKFSLGDEEGIALMCLAEALLRIPDDQTAWCELISDKLKRGDPNPIGKSNSFFINAASYGLLLEKNISNLDDQQLSNALTTNPHSSHYPFNGMYYIMKILGR